MPTPRLPLMLGGVLIGFAVIATTPAANEREVRARSGDDTSGHPQRGEASYYHPSLQGRPMANGERFDAQSNSAASRSLPLGTTARVTNLRNGRTATVEVEDRGPYARRRILDVSPRTAEQLDMRRNGTARVEVAPIDVPQRDGSRRPGAGATGGAPQ